MKKNKSYQVEVIKNPDLGRRLRVNVSKRIGFTETETKRHQSAADLLEIVVNSLEFKKKVLAKKFTTTNLTPAQIYDKIMTGEEDLQKGHDYEMDITVEIYEKNNRTVGYTYPSTVQTWVNRKFFRQYTLGEIACNIFHEWLHKLGFGHASATDYLSVPYSLGYLIEEMVNDYQKGIRYVDLYPVIVKVPVLVETVEPVGEAPTPIKMPIPMPSIEKKRVCRRPWYYLWLRQICTYEVA